MSGNAHQQDEETRAEGVPMAQAGKEGTSLDPASYVSRYVAAVFPDSWRILGKRLLPISVGHVLLFERIGHPIAVGGVGVDAVDIATATAILRRPAAAAARRLGTWRFKVEVWWLALRASRFPASARGLKAYLAAFLDRPRWWLTEGSAGRSSGVPFWLAVQVTLERDFGLSQEQALETPANLALWKCAVHWESLGSIQIATEAEEQLMRGEAGK